ncbi:unnamed protein product [Linum trigynum]|uniref:Uncharacterized protein n=1 Tax=Linum trigynum TaxID=586398 RepID=A0AAV2FVG2_9ROSI
MLCSVPLLDPYFSRHQDHHHPHHSKAFFPSHLVFHLLALHVYRLQFRFSIVIFLFSFLVFGGGEEERPEEKEMSPPPTMMASYV